MWLAAAEVRQAKNVNRAGPPADIAQPGGDSHAGESARGDGCLQRLAAEGQLGGKHRGVGTAGAVRGAVGVARTGDLDDRPTGCAVEEEIGDLRAMATGEHHDARAEGKQSPNQLSAIAGGVATDEHAGLGQIGGEDGGARNDLLDERPVGVGLQQSRTRLGDHDGIDDDGRARRQLIERTGDGKRDLGSAEHSHLDGTHTYISRNRTHLSQNNLGGNRMDGGDAERVLRGDGCDGAGAVHAAARKRLEVGLDTGPAAGV